MRNILFICTGNTCRSPLAEYLLRAKAQEQLHVQSAGIAAMPGMSAATHVQQLLAEKDINVVHSSKQVDDALMEWADIILTMTTGHREQLLHYYPQKADFIFTLKEYVEPDSYTYDIMDPFGGSRKVYQETMQEMEQLVHKLVQKLKEEQ